MIYDLHPIWIVFGRIFMETSRSFILLCLLSTFRQWQIRTKSSPQSIATWRSRSHGMPQKAKMEASLGRQVIVCSEVDVQVSFFEGAMVDLGLDAAQIDQRVRSLWGIEGEVSTLALYSFMKCYRRKPRQVFKEAQCTCFVTYALGYFAWE